MAEREVVYISIVIIVGIVSLAILAVAYWLLTGQDGAALTTISAAIGGIIGYFIKYLIERLRARRGGRR